MTAVLRETATELQRGRPWELPLEDRILLVTAYWRTNLTMRQIAPLFGISNPVQRDQRPADQRVIGQCLITAGGGQVDRALCPPQRRTLVPGLLHQPAHVLCVPGTERQQATPGGTVAL